jgi:hypothetical protein
MKRGKRDELFGVKELKTPDSTDEFLFIIEFYSCLKTIFSKLGNNVGLS